MLLRVVWSWYFLYSLDDYIFLSGVIFLLPIFLHGISFGCKVITVEWFSWEVTNANSGGQWFQWAHFTPTSLLIKSVTSVGLFHRFILLVVFRVISSPFVLDNPNWTQWTRPVLLLQCRWHAGCPPQPLNLMMTGSQEQEEPWGLTVGYKNYFPMTLQHNITHRTFLSVWKTKGFTLIKNVDRFRALCMI